MKSILAASPPLLLAGAMMAIPAAAQTMAQPGMDQPAAQPYSGQTMQSQPYGYQAMPQPQTVQGTLPQGSYLTECKEVRMLGDTLTGFCPRGDGTWQTTQLVNASSCPGGVQNAGGDLVCGTPSQVGSTAAPENYSSSSGGTSSGTTPAPAAGYGAFGTGPQPMATSTYPSYAPVPSQSYAAPAYNGYGANRYNPYGGYPPAANPYGGYPAAATPYGSPSPSYVSPSPTTTAQPPY